MNIFGLKFVVVCLGTLVQDGLAHMRGVIWRAAPAKFKTGMCEMKILGSEVLWKCLCNIGSGLAHMRGVIWRAAPEKFKRGMCEGELFRQSSNTGMCEMKTLGSEVLWCVFATLVQGWHTCVVSSVPSCSGKVRNRDV